MNVKLMLQTCGINTKISFIREESQSYLPDGKGGKKYFDTKPLWRLCIASNQLQQLLDEANARKAQNELLAKASDIKKNHIISFP